MTNEEPFNNRYFTIAGYDSITLNVVVKIFIAVVLLTLFQNNSSVINVSAAAYLCQCLLSTFVCMWVSIFHFFGMHYSPNG